MVIMHGTVCLGSMAGSVQRGFFGRTKIPEVQLLGPHVDRGSEPRSTSARHSNILEARFTGGRLESESFCQRCRTCLLRGHGWLFCIQPPLKLLLKPREPLSNHLPGASVEPVGYAFETLPT